MKVFVIKFSKQDLLKLSSDERSLVLQLGHVCNELAFLNKLLLVVSNFEREGVERTVATAQSMIVVRLYIGKVFEAWRMIGKQYFGSDLRGEFDHLLPEHVVQSLTKLKKTFGSKDLFAQLRNKFSFHYQSDHIDEVVDLLPDDYECRLISGGTYASTLYAFSEDVVTYGMLNKTDESSPQEAMEKVIGDLVSVSGVLIDYASSLLGVILESRLGVPLEHSAWEHHDVQVEADLVSFKMPFFFKRGT